MDNQEFIMSIMLEGEQWRDVVGYEGLYIVSNFGRIASLPKIVERRHLGKTSYYPIKGGIKRQFLRGRKFPKYLYVDLYSGFKTFKSKMVHRVVSDAFIPNPEKKPCIDHIDGNPLNNSVLNLRWSTHLENSHNPITEERTKKARCRAILKLKNGAVVERFDSMNSAIDAGYNDSRIRICFKNPKSTHRGFNWVREADYKSLVSMSKNSSTPMND